MRDMHSLLFDHLSALSSNDRGTLGPKALAVFRFIASSNFVGCCFRSSYAGRHLAISAS